MAPFVRIFLHILTGALMTYGLLSADAAEWFRRDPDVQFVVSIGLGFVAQAIAWGWYAMAKRFGWNT